MRGPFFLGLLYVLSRRWPAFLQARIYDVQPHWHTDGAKCLNRWCEQRRY